MSAATVIEIRCDGPFPGDGCPASVWVSRGGQRSIAEVRQELRRNGWGTAIPVFDLPAADRCPGCGGGAA